MLFVVLLFVCFVCLCTLGVVIYVLLCWCWLVASLLFCFCYVRVSVLCFFFSVVLDYMLSLRMLFFFVFLFGWFPCVCGSTVVMCVLIYVDVALVFLVCLFVRVVFVCLLLLRIIVVCVVCRLCFLRFCLFVLVALYIGGCCLCVVLVWCCLAFVSRFWGILVCGTYE